MSSSSSSSSPPPALERARAYQRARDAGDTAALVRMAHPEIVVHALGHGLVHGVRDVQQRAWSAPLKPHRVLRDWELLHDEPEYVVRRLDASMLQDRGSGGYGSWAEFAALPAGRAMACGVGVKTGLVTAAAYGERSDDAAVQEALVRLQRLGAGGDERRCVLPETVSVLWPPARRRGMLAAAPAGGGSHGATLVRATAAFNYNRWWPLCHVMQLDGDGRIRALLFWTTGPPLDAAPSAASVPAPRSAPRPQPQPAAAAAGDDTGMSDNDRQSVALRTAQQYMRAREAGDTAALEQLVHDDVVFRVLKHGIQRGRARARELWFTRDLRPYRLVRDWEHVRDTTYIVREVDSKMLTEQGSGGYASWEAFFAQPGPYKAFVVAMAAKVGIITAAAWGVSAGEDAAVRAALQQLEAVQRRDERCRVYTETISVVWPLSRARGVLAAAAGAGTVTLARSTMVANYERWWPVSHLMVVSSSSSSTAAATSGRILMNLWWTCGPPLPFRQHEAEAVFDPSLPIHAPSYWLNQVPTGFFATVRSEYVRRVATAVLNGTRRSVATRDRSGSRRVPSAFRVLQVFRIDNAALWQAYAQKREEIRAARGRVGSVTAKTQPLLPPAVARELDANVNEAYLFHGTAPEAVMGISRSGFSINLAGTSAGTAFGVGSYFAECSSKSDEYAVAAKVSRIYRNSPVSMDAAFAAREGTFAMILSRVCLGKVCRITEFDPNGHERVLGRGRRAHDARRCKYDSLLGDREAAKGTYREFVVYDGKAVYPEYGVIYERVY